jgi:predicted TIM-barrel fold metal-dependent hydrolase
MPFLDVHTHAYPKEDLNLVLERTAFLDGHLPPDSPDKWQLCLDGTLEALVEEERLAGLEKFVLLPVSGRPNGSSRMNRWVAGKAAKYPMVIPFASLTPQSKDPEEDLKEALALGLKGIKIHSVLQRIAPLNQTTLKWLEMIEASGLPVLMDSMNLRGIRARKPHMGMILDAWEPYETGPLEIATLARTFPRISFIAAHLGCLYGWDRLDPLYGLKNVFFDLSYALEILPPRDIKKVIHKKGADQVLFGSDAPWRHPRESLEKFLTLGLKDQEVDKIGRENLINLLNLKPNHVP